MRERLYFLIFIFAWTFVFSQDKESLQKQNIDLKKEIDMLNADLTKYKKNISHSVANLRRVDRMMNLRRKLYKNTNWEKIIIERDIARRQSEIVRYKHYLDNLRKDYAEILIRAYKNSRLQNKMLFILSSKDIGEGFRRVQYLKQYADFQKKKSDEILEKTQQIEEAIALREKAKKEKESIILKQQKELKNIQNEKRQREALVAESRKNQSRITKQIKQKQNESKKLEQRIKKIIETEIQIAKKKEEERQKARMKAKASSGDNVKLLEGSADYNIPGGNFADNRGKLPSPVKGEVTHKFGRHPHPMFKNIWEENSGIKISVSQSVDAKAVFPGVVSKILYLGGSKTVMVKHNTYFTVYSNLSSVSVTQNQTISAGTSIGKIGLDLDGAHTLDFQIWKGNTPIDPLKWIKY